MQEDKNKIKIYLQMHQFIWIIASNFTYTTNLHVK